MEELNNLKELSKAIDFTGFDALRRMQIRESFRSDCELAVRMKSIADAPFSLRGLAAFIPLIILSIIKFHLFDMLSIMCKEKCMLTIDEFANEICIFKTDGRKPPTFCPGW